MFFHRARNLDDSYFGTQPEHRFIISTSASQVSILLSSPSLILSRRLDTSPVFPPSLPLLVCGGSSFLSFFSLFYLSSPVYPPRLCRRSLLLIFSSFRTFSPPPLPLVSPLLSPSSHFISSCCLYSYSTCHYLLIYLSTCRSSGEKNYSQNSLRIQFSKFEIGLCLPRRALRRSRRAGSVKARGRLVFW